MCTWIRPSGLTLNVTKTRIRHTLEGDQPGMDRWLVEGRADDAIRQFVENLERAENAEVHASATRAG